MRTRLFGKENIKVLFVRPPCHLWPIVNESDNFLLPLSFPCLGAYLLERCQGVEVKVIDALPLKIGWKSLKQRLAEEKPDVVGVGDQIIYMHEGVRALKLAKELFPDAVTVAGAHFHSHLPEYSLKNYPQIDFIVRYEGEETLAELIEALRDGSDLNNVKSLSFRQEGSIKSTPVRPLIHNLDDLPIPAYDLMPVERYSPFGILWPRAITIQGGRGCPYQCDFCSWHAMENEHFEQDGHIVVSPRHRLKSPERTMAEIDLLYEHYDIRYLFWVDGTWNADNAWLDELCGRIIKKNYKLGWWAFVRADLMLEQEKLGILEKMVRAGLRHILVGGERPVNPELEAVGKDSGEAGSLYRVSRLLKKKYPEVFRQATFLTGIRSESRETLKQLGRYSRDCALDFAAFHPLMPYPGTKLWEQARENDWIEEEDFSKYDMFFPIMSSEHLSRSEISEGTQALYKDFVRRQPFRYLKGLMSPYSIRRKLHWWFLFSIARVLIRDMLLAVFSGKKFEGFAAVSRLWKPGWYDD